MMKLLASIVLLAFPVATGGIGTREVRLLPRQILENSGPGTQDKKLEVPDDAAQKEAEKTIRGIFKDDYAKRAPADRLALAKNLLRQGAETKDDNAARYVLLRESQDLAARGGDLDTAFRAVDEMCRVYATNPLALKNGVLAAAAGMPRTPEEQKAVAQAYVTLAEEACQARQFDLAAKAAQSALAAAKKGKDVPLVTKAESQSKAMAAVQERYERAKKSIETLAAAPDSPEANQAVGEFECFTLGDWEGGLPKIAKGSDPALKALAARDLSKPSEAAELSALGDAWWDRAEKETGLSRSNLRQRAAHWYEQAIAKLSGLSKVKVEKRLEELGGAKGDRNTAESPAARLVPTKGLVGQWLFDEGKGTTAADTSGRGNHGSLNGGVKWVPGVFGSALSFDGSAGFVSLGVSGLPASEAPKTVAWWQWVEKVHDGYGVMIAFSDIEKDMGLHALYWQGKVGMNIWGGAFLAAIDPPPGNQWLHFAYTFDGKTNRLYLNGELKDSSTASPLKGAVKRFEFGRWGGSRPGATANGHFAGILDEVRIYDRPLSDSEVQVLAKKRK
jgi:hypothetical protein